jgi:hypothetical protein
MATQSLALPAHSLAFELDLALLAVFQKIAAAQKRGFARPGRADQRYDMPARRHQIDALEDLKLAIGLVQIADFDDGRVGHGAGLRLLLRGEPVIPLSRFQAW